MAFQNPDGSFGNEAQGGPVSVVNPNSGDTVTMRYGERSLFVNNGATLASLTITLPLGVLPGGKVELASKNAITALTVHDGFGNAITGAPTSSTAGAAAVMRYVNASVGWVHWK